MLTYEDFHFTFKETFHVEPFLEKLWVITIRKSLESLLYTNIQKSVLMQHLECMCCVSIAVLNMSCYAEKYLHPHLKKKNKERNTF